VKNDAKRQKNQRKISQCEYFVNSNIFALSISQLNIVAFLSSENMVPRNDFLFGLLVALDSGFLAGRIFGLDCVGQSPPSVAAAAVVGCESGSR